jgi:hypothetical protein
MNIMSLNRGRIKELSREMKKIIGVTDEAMNELTREIEEDLDAANRKLATINIISFVSVAIASANTIGSSNDISTLCRNIAVSAFACTICGINCFRSVKETEVLFSIYDLIIPLSCGRIDEEGQGYLSDLKSEWIKLELSQEQIKGKELIFIADYYWGRFIAWMRLPRFLNFTKIR